MSAPSDARGDPRLSVVVLTHRRRDALARTLAQLAALPERPAIVVVDNGSADGTAEMVRRRFPQATLVELPDNRGAAGRNAGVERVRTPYVAFCDDDTWWAPGALGRAADLLDAHRRLAALNARVLVGEQARPDPTCDRMAASPLPREGLPGPSLVGFMAGAVVMRCSAFRSAGGYEPRFFLGAEEALLALDLLALGWRMAYVRELVLHHHPSPHADPARRLTLLRNRLWIAALRLPPALAWHEGRKVAAEARAQGLLGPALRAALRGLPWVLRERQALPPAVAAMFATVHGGPVPWPLREAPAWKR